MRFADIPGNEDIRRALTGMADSGRVAHAMLFYENEGCGALPLVLAYFQYLNCQDRHDGDSCGECPSCRKISRLIHPDLHFVFPVNTGSKVSASEKPVSDTYMEYWRDLVLADPYFLESDLYSALGIEGKSGNIAVAEAKSVISKLSLSSVEDGYRAIVVWLPEKMNAEAANRLLKIVEEPPEKTLFLFVTHAPDKMLQTIFSRCQSFRIPPLSKAQVSEILESRFSVSPDRAKVLAGISGGSVGVALSMIGDKEEHGEYAVIFRKLMTAMMSRDLTAALEAGEDMASLSSREKQKGFCIFAADCVRKIFMIRKGLVQISNAAEDELPLLSDIAAGTGDGFCDRAAGILDRASALIDRNVNARIVFCDLVDRLFLSI